MKNIIGQILSPVLSLSLALSPLAAHAQEGSRGSEGARGTTVNLPPSAPGVSLGHPGAQGMMGVSVQGPNSAAAGAGGTSVSVAGENGRSFKAADFRQEFKNVVYSIKTIPDIQQDMNFQYGAGERAISQSVAAEINSRMSAGISLMALIYADQSISEKERAEMSLTLAESIGEVLFVVLRNYGDPKVDFSEKVADVSTASAVLKEIMFDVKSLFVPRRSANGETVWGPVERVQRDRLGQNIISDLQGFAQTVLPRLAEGNKLRNAQQGFWNEDVVDRAIKIRERGVNAKKITAAIYLGMALYGILAPHIDIVGLIDGRSDNSLFVSSMIYFSAWITIAMVKLQSISVKTVKALKDLSLLLQGRSDLVRSNQGSSFVTVLKTDFSQKPDLGPTMCRKVFGD